MNSIKIISIAGILLWAFGVQAQPKTGSVAVKDGKITTIADERGNCMPDYSYCGYGASEKDIPWVPAVIFVPWQEEDASAVIQKAIDYVSGCTPDRSGYRGAVLLDKGVFRLSAPLRITVAGVVLRGQGVGERGTVLKKEGVDRGALVYIEGKNDRRVTSDTLRVTASYVPVGSRELPLKEAAQFKPGERVTVVRPSTLEWIKALGCNVFGGGIGALGWRAGEMDICWDRKITDVTGNGISLSAPLTVALDNTFGGGYLLRYSWPGRISECGVEYMTLESDYDPSNLKDEDHCWTGITVANAENCWVRRVNFRHFAGSAVLLQPTASLVTVEDCISRQPVSEIGGMRRMTFLTMGQQTLFQRCYSEQGIHDFAVGFCAPGPNAFVQCDSKESFGFSGPVDSWACGLLYDIVNIDGHDLCFKNLGQSKNGGGWNTANSMFWQCTASEIACYSPAADAVNRAYGAWSQFSGDGEWLQANNHIQPRSLFYALLEQRLGQDCRNRARILPRNTSASSSPTVEQAMKMAKEAYTPRLTLEHWIEEGEFPTEQLSGKLLSVHALKVKTTDRPVENGKVEIRDGRIVWDGALLTGGRHEVPWWNGRLRTDYLPKAKPHITRFVPGREGLGLTDRIDSVVRWMKQNHIRVLDHNYGLWYERRRDDHERIRRRDGDVWGPFYEQPFARSGTGTAWEGLSKYDLKRPNKWYWARLKEFADKGAREGLLLFHENYFQHNILEAGAHWVDCPWRSANNINGTGFPEPVPFAGDKRIFMADLFYDIDHPVRRELHRQYIRQCLDNFAGCGNVVQLISAEFTGPLHFVEFWLDVIGEWEQETGKKALVALSTTKDVQDAILNDPKRAAIVDIIDIRYWHYKDNGELYAPEGGKNLAPRQHARKMKVGKVSFEDAYRAVWEYREKYPEKAVTYYAQNYPPMAWAVFMAGGSCPVLPEIKDAGFLAAAAQAKPVKNDLPKGVKMVKSDTDVIIFSQSKQEMAVPLKKGNYCLKMINPSSGVVSTLVKKMKGDQNYLLKETKDRTGIFWFEKL